jgi:hypothetical protein
MGGESHHLGAAWPGRGLGNTTWKGYVDAAKAHWVVRYLQPGESAWKEILWESFILEDAAGNERYPEGRSILLHKLSKVSI